MTKYMRNTIIYVALLLICCLFGSIAGYVFSGVITLASLVFLIENSSTLKSIVYHCNRLIDIIIFAFGIYCKLTLGVTIGMAVMFAGLGYSMVYGPYIHATYKLKSKK